MSRTRDIAGAPRNVYGWKPSPRDPRDRKLSTPGWLARRSLPARAYVVETALTVEDQANIGSCTCNAGSSMQEYVAWLQSGGQESYQLSRLWLYAKVRQFENVPLTEDAGAFNRDVMKVLAKQGCPLEADWPYDLNKWATSPPPSLDSKAMERRAAYYYAVPNLWTLKASIVQGFPVLFGFTVPRNMWDGYTAATGIVRRPDPGDGFDGGHAVLAVGYDDDLKLVKFLNSWSRQWGDDGYGFIDYWYFENGLADDCWSLRTVET